MKKNFLIDLIVNTVSNLSLLFFIQLILFPVLNKNIGTVNFGLLTSVYGISIVFISTFGDSLTDMRIVLQEYSESRLFKKFYINILFSVIISFLLFIFFANKLGLINILLFSLSIGLGVIRRFYSAQFRVSLSFYKLLVTNLLILVGYLGGLVLFFTMGNWGVIFFLGELVGCIFLYKTAKTNRQFDTDKIIDSEYSSLRLTYFFNSTGSYLDRFIIIPILGPEKMAFYYAASSVSKIFSLLVSQVNTVLLSYIMKLKRKMTRKNIVIIFIFSSICVVLLLPVLVTFTNIIVKVLYTNLYTEASQLTTFTVFGTLLNSQVNVFKSLYLKDSRVSKMLSIQVFGTLSYFFIALFLSYRYGIVGFALSVIISNAGVLIIYLVSLLKTSKNS